MRKFKILVGSVLSLLFWSGSLVAADWNTSPSDVWVYSRAAEGFVALGLHVPDTLSAKVINMPIGEYHIIFKMFKDLNFGRAQIQGVNPRFMSDENGSAMRAWRMWEYFAAMLFGGVIGYSQEDYVGKLMDLSPHYRWLTTGEYGDNVARKFQDAVGNNRVPLVQAYARAVFNKHCKVLADARARKIGSQAKIERLAGADPVTSGSFEKIEFVSGGKPLYLSVWGHNILVSTSKYQNSGKVTKFFDPMVAGSYKDFVSQNALIEFVSGKSNNFATNVSFNPTDDSVHYIRKYWMGLVLQTGLMIRALSNSAEFNKRFMCRHEHVFQDMYYEHNIFSGRYGNQNSGNGRDQKSNYGYKNAEAAWLTFNGDGFNSYFTSNLANHEIMHLDTPLTQVETLEKVSKYTGDGSAFVHAPDGQVYRSDIGMFLLRYRDACYDVSGSKNYVAMIVATDQANALVNSGNFEPKWLLVKDTRGVKFDRAWFPNTSLNAARGINDNIEGVNALIDEERKVPASLSNSPISDGKYINLPAGEDNFVMVEVGMDDSVWALCGSGKPYMVKNEIELKQMMSPLHGDLKFAKIAVGAAKPWKAIGITKAGEIYLLIDPDLGLWQNTGLKGTHASIDDLGNMAIIGFDDNIYKLKSNDP